MNERTITTIERDGNQWQARTTWTDSSGNKRDYILTDGWDRSERLYAYLRESLYIPAACIEYASREAAAQSGVSNLHARSAQS